jgi:hypothetical protein
LCADAPVRAGVYHRVIPYLAQRSSAMTDHPDNVKGPHGVTGDTVQQAAEVSRPTATVGRVVDNHLVFPVPGESKTETAIGSNGAPGTPPEAA